MGKKVQEREIEIVTDDKGDLDVIKGEKKIPKESGDPEIKGLYDKFKRNRLQLQPDFQRHFVWDSKKASWLIESAIIGLPLPVFYFAEEEDETVSVIDGQQRLTSFFSFIDGKFPDGKPFKLTNLKVFPELNRKGFGDIPDRMQDKIQEFKVRAITFFKEAPRDLKFLMFERLNSGSAVLNAQELRNCVYRGSYNDLLRELSRDDKYSKLTGFNNPHKRMGDVELVLRFAAFYFQKPDGYASPMKKFLNVEMEKRQTISKEDAKKLRIAFKKAVDLSASLLAENAYTRFAPGTEENPNGNWEVGKLNASLHDVLMYGFAVPNIDKNLVMNNLETIREEFIRLMVNDAQFSDSIQLGTSEAKKVSLRFTKWLNTLNGILYHKNKQPRLFSRRFKEKIFKKDPTCEICGNRIEHIDDAAVDHIEQYWLGGKTIPENARLTHRYCNNARPRKE